MGFASRLSALEEFVAGEAEALRADVEARLPEVVAGLAGGPAAWGAEPASGVVSRYLTS